MERIKPELLAPAGDWERLEAAVRYGADAVYLAGKSFGMRSAPANFGPEELAQAVDFCHQRGVKVYITCNTLPRNQEFEELPGFLTACQEAGVDAFIISDLGVLALAGKVAPQVERHISTQTGIVNFAAAQVCWELGAKRVVLAREVPLSEIQGIRENTDPGLELEAFVHGAMCMSFSGRCVISNYMTGRDANRGECAQPCRWEYHLVEAQRPGEVFTLTQEEKGAYFFNSNDLRMIDAIPQMMDAGITSLKIEGRMKTALYVATVARTYRKAIDDYLRDPALYREHLPWYREQITGCTYRRFTTGFFYGKPSEQDQIYDSNTYAQDYVYLGIAGERDGQGRTVMEQKNKFSAGESVEIMKPDGGNISVKVLEICDGEGNFQESAPHPKQELHVRFSEDPEPWDIIRKKA